MGLDTPFASPKCRYCGRTFMDGALRRKHERRIHEGKRNEGGRRKSNQQRM